MVNKSYNNSPKPKKAQNVLNLGKVKISGFMKGSLSLAEVWWYYRKNESSIYSTVLNSMHHKHLRFMWVYGSSGFLEPYTHRYQSLLYLTFKGTTVF
jgi:hypothetical protein